ASDITPALPFRHLTRRVVIGVANYAVLVAADDSAVARAVGIKEPILLGDRPVRVEVTQEREVDSALLLKGFQGPCVIDADADYDRVVAEATLFGLDIGHLLRANA